MTITLSESLSQRVRARAQEAGIDPETAAEALIERALALSNDLSAEEIQGIELAIDRGDADFAAGRFHSSETVFARLQAKYASRQ